jgi:hypothetical protein
MGDPLLLVAVIGLGLSALASAIRLIDWFLHSDPKAIANAGRWAAVGLAILSVPLLFGLLLTQRWTAAISLAAVMLLAFAFYGPRLVRSFFPQRLVPDWSPPKGAAATHSYDMEPTDPELVRRSIRNGRVPAAHHRHFQIERNRWESGPRAACRERPIP